MIHLRAPAKLNLSLRVLGKRPDGYHEIETLFERIDLADELTFEDGPRQLTLTCSDPTLSCGEDNLILKAARLLQATVGASRGARIHLVKRIPVAAGLGGGSSDAATTLMGLSRLWGLELEPPQLRSLAAQLGSDVPFFLSETPFAIGRGRGELCEPIPQAPVLSHVLVVPNERLSTKAVYEGFSLTGAPPSLTMMQHALSNGSLRELAEGLGNDLAPEAIRRCPVITLIQSHVRACGCVGAGVSGSGPAVFGLCTDGTHARTVAALLGTRSPRTWRIELVRTDHP